MSDHEVKVFLASRFEEFRELRAQLARKFAHATAQDSRYKLLDFDSDARGLPPIVDFCLRNVRACEIFVLLLGKTYPSRGAGRDGVSISHMEYLEALKTQSLRRIFVFLTRDPYQERGTQTPVENELLQSLLRKIRDSTNRAGHTTLTLPGEDQVENAEWIHAQIDSALRNSMFLADRSRIEEQIEGRLDPIVMLGPQSEQLELPGARDRLQGANEQARETFVNRHVPENPFPRRLFRRNDSGRQKIEDFDARLQQPGCGKVLGIVSPSGQGKSTFVADFPRKYRLAEQDYLFVTARELRGNQLEQLFLDVALVAKARARSEKSIGSAPPRFHLLVDALNECSRSDSLLLDLIVWLEQLVETAARCQWPLVVILTMRPDVAKTVPELSRRLVTPGNTYDLERFGRKEYEECAARNGLRTPYDGLSVATREILEDPFMLGIVGKIYSGCEVPLEDSDLDLLATYLKRLTTGADLAASEALLRAARIFGARLLVLNEQTLTADTVERIIDDATLTSLLSAGILTDEPEQSRGREDLERIGFKYDRVAEYCIGRHVQGRLENIPAADWQAGKAKLIDALMNPAAQEKLADIATLGELHRSGLCLGLFFFLERDREETRSLLIPLMQHTDPAWRMLARSVLLKLYASARERGQSAFANTMKTLAAYANDNRSNKDFRAELMRACFEVIKADNHGPPAAHRTQTLDLILEPLCTGLNSRDQEIADLAITSLSSLLIRPALVPILLGSLCRQIEKMNLSLLAVVGSQIAARISVKLRGLLELRGGDREVALPLFSVLKLLIVCFASNLEKSGHQACQILLSTLLKQLNSTGVGRAVGTRVGRACMLFLLSTMLGIALRHNKMPINAREWKDLVRDPRQFDAFRKTTRMASPTVMDIDPDRIVAQIAGDSPSPFIYQTLLTALSSKYELSFAPGANPQLRDKVLQTVRGLIAADRGNGVCKYVASLVLYHINTFGDHGDNVTARLMSELAIDILQTHDGMLSGKVKQYTSNVIGTTGRSLLRLTERGVKLDEDAFTFIRAQIDKVASDGNGTFTQYLIENLALLAVLTPENEAVHRLIKEEIQAAALSSGRGPIHSIEGWVIDAFVRIRAAHPVAVDSYLVRRQDNSLYHAVRKKHAQEMLSGNAQGLDSELVSWAFERVSFELIVRATSFATRVHQRWCDGIDGSRKLRPSTWVQLGLIGLEEGMAWARTFDARDFQARSTSTP